MFTKTAEDEATKEGAIFPDSEKGKELGFTKELFDGYLWHIPGSDHVIISLIVSNKPKQGNCKRLIEKLLDTYGIVKIPSPSGPMQQLCTKFNCTWSREHDKELDLSCDTITIRKTP